MLSKRQNIPTIIKQLPFLLVLCALLLQPIANTFSVFYDTSFELVDFEDDTEEEVEDKTEKETKIEPRLHTTTLSYYNLRNTNENYYLKHSIWSCHLDILIPPPRQT